MRERERESLKNMKIHQYKVKIQKIFFKKLTKKEKKNMRKKESNNLFV